MTKTKIGILGIGNMGTSHAKHIFAGNVPHMELAAVCDVDPARLKWAEENLPSVPRFASAEEMIASGLCDSILIAVPHYDHEKYTVMAFEAGLHVYCEKPGAVYTLQGLHMIEAAKKSGKVFCVGFQQRTNPTFQKIREMVRSGELGHVKKVIWIVTNWYRPQAYHDSMSELYDIMLSMVQEDKDVETIARAVSKRRNELRLEAEKDNPEALALVRKRNLETYGNEEGPTADDLLQKYGSWDMVLYKALGTNAGMDACLGFYDEYYYLYDLENEIGAADE